MLRRNNRRPKWRWLRAWRDVEWNRTNIANRDENPNELNVSWLAARKYGDDLQWKLCIQMRRCWTYGWPNFGKGSGNTTRQGKLDQRNERRIPVTYWQQYMGIDSGTKRNKIDQNKVGVQDQEKQWWRYKARMVAKGYTFQVRFLMAVAVQKKTEDTSTRRGNGILTRGTWRGDLPRATRGISRRHESCLLIKKSNLWIEASRPAME